MQCRGFPGGLGGWGISVLLSDSSFLEWMLELLLLFQFIWLEL
jgi:hypothetical protein